jgi:hypothetical protein
MDRSNSGREHEDLPAARGPGLDPVPAERTHGPAATVPGPGDWSESVWSPPGFDALGEGPQLFADPFAEAELRREMRLSELWRRCEDGTCTLSEFFELSTLIGEVDGVRGRLCADCALLDRPNERTNWALADTALCRGHLRFRLGHARVDGGGSNPSL